MCAHSSMKLLDNVKIIQIKPYQIWNGIHWTENLRFVPGECLKDKYTHNTCQIYVKPHSKNTQITLESQIFDEKALR